MRYPPDGKSRYAVVMGHGGETYGLAVHDSTDDLHLLYSGLAPEKLAGRMACASVIFDTVLSTPFDDLDDMARYGWPVASDSAYPVPIKVTRAGNFTRPGKSELLWFEAAMLAIPSFVRDYMQADRGRPHLAEATLTVATADGEAEIRLRYPVSGFDHRPGLTRPNLGSGLSPRLKSRSRKQRKIRRKR